MPRIRQTFSTKSVASTMMNKVKLAHTDRFAEEISITNQVSRVRSTASGVSSHSAGDTSANQGSLRNFRHILEKEFTRHAWPKKAYKTVFGGVTA